MKETFLTKSWKSVNKTSLEVDFMSFETIQFELRDAVAIITMNRPDALNALSLQLTKDLRAAIERAVAENARAIILTGAGRAFCSGGDLR